jgi:hypothetical protein
MVDSLDTEAQILVKEVLLLARVSERNLIEGDDGRW